MSLLNIETAVTFGPFRMPNLQEHVNDRLREAFYAYLAERVLPMIEGKVTRVEGRFFSHYDRPEFSSNSAVQRRYYYNVVMISPKGSEDAWGELDYEPASATLTPNHAKPPGVRTLSQKRVKQERERAEREFQEKYADHPKDSCPRCLSKAVAAIAYGLFPIPLPASVKTMRDEGIFVLGGCTISSDSPSWCCLDCGCRWGIGLSRRRIKDLMQLLTSENGS